MFVLETKRLLLRELEPADLDALSAILSDRETMRFYPQPFDRAAVSEWIERNRRRYRNDGHGLWAMVLKTNNELIGDCGLIRQHVDGVDETEIGYHVRRDLWDQGFATEAACVCRDYGFGQLTREQLISLIRPENLQSRRVAEKVGLAQWKQVMHHSLLHYVYRISRPGQPY
jgi:[ribosomal protein S5]-alanine N-acetyltransferase